MQIFHRTTFALCNTDRRNIDHGFRLEPNSIPEVLPGSPFRFISLFHLTDAICTISRNSSHSSSKCVKPVNLFFELCIIQNTKTRIVLYPIMYPIIYHILCATVLSYILLCCIPYSTHSPRARILPAGTALRVLKSRQSTTGISAPQMAKAIAEMGVVP